MAQAAGTAWSIAKSSWKNSQRFPARTSFFLVGPVGGWADEPMTVRYVGIFVGLPSGNLTVCY